MVDDTKSDPPATDAASYVLWAHDVARYGDTDRQGHVNNAVFSTFLETGRVAFLHAPGNPLCPSGCGFVIVRLALDFRAELHWGKPVEIGSAVQAVGRSSFTMRQAIFQDGRCAATAETVIVLMDDATRRATALPDGVRERLAMLSR